MNNKSCFILTSDEEVAEILIKANYILITKDNNGYVFENSNILTFSSDVDSKIVYSNIMFL